MPLWRRENTVEMKFKREGGMPWPPFNYYDFVKELVMRV
jgi:hypothetical protein